MLVEIGTVLATLPLMLVSKAIGIQFNENPYFLTVFQMAFGGVFGYAVAATLTLPVGIVAVGSTILPLIINAVVVIDRKWQKKRTLSGKYGLEARWAAEIVKAGDPEFAFAVKVLPNRDLREIGIIAKDKQEVRELTIERLEELSDDHIPEDFAQ